MPLTAADVFVCTGIGETPLHTIMPVRRAPAMREVWLVLLMCEHCLYPARRYCAEHNQRNWWLMNGPVPGRPTAGRRTAGRG
jgi:hypothetical protein